ncbi:hypothetical protein [Nannocystis punicea]|uniref:DUF1707 domain-containing protein n=1 Tax=Nannocystis punicea TaxID=2995304 RepID=A0ABY7GSW2_9BACT|nr:hypothetical protein [Nannocystis poenicansa]WAS90043.1 hypothetical protein O0S08_27940 [Nannocystis poenicansa]
MADDRRYDDREVGLILKRVAELQAGEGDRADARAMTRAEIEQVVGELGFSKALVARAVSELSVQDLRNRSVWHLGGKTDLMFEEVVEGTIDEATLTRMLEALRRHLGEPGKLEREGGAQIWSTREGGRRIHFTVVPVAGRTTLRVEERMPVDAGATVGVGAFLGGFLGFMSLVPLKVLLAKSLLLLLMGPLALMGAILGWLVGRATWKRVALAREEVLRRVFSEIVAVAAARDPTRPALPADEDEST